MAEEESEKKEVKPEVEAKKEEKVEAEAKTETKAEEKVEAKAKADEKKTPTDEITRRTTATPTNRRPSTDNRRRPADGDRKPYRKYYRRRQKPEIPSYIDWKDIEFLERFIPERGKILPRRISGISAKDQRRLARAIKRARVMAMLPYVAD